ncbi:hypothetical protein EB796_018726 [Bugula neritina]|uniref:ATP synthase F(0) complex subunit e, mitochondrial n=1 Tax=Bugula neritina TaxID=10212 RepID=A0A7J7J9R7_BUGNE|nr:hypothetical protein EB796_018726 [Bugula neritina]
MPSVPHKSPNPATSPLVRGSRYVMLGLGILYGSWQMKRLSKKEVEIQKVEDAIRAKRDARLAKEAEANMKVEMNDLAKEMGVENRM